MAQSKIVEDNKECNGTEAIDMIVFSEDENKELICGAAGIGQTYHNELVTDEEIEKIEKGELTALKELAERMGKNIENLTRQEIQELLEKIDSKNPIIQRVLNDINQESMRRTLEGTNEYDVSSAKDNSSKEMQK